METMLTFFNAFSIAFVVEVVKIVEYVAVQISQHHLLKRLFLFHFMLLPPLSNIN